MAYYDFSKYLTPESKKIFDQNLRRKLVIVFLGLIALLISVVRNRNAYKTGTSSVMVAVYATVALLVLDTIYNVICGRSYIQLRHRDIAKGKNDAKEILKSMEGMGDGKK